MIISVWFEDHDAATDSSPCGPLLVRETLRNAARQELRQHHGYPLIAWVSDEP